MTTESETGENDESESPTSDRIAITPNLEFDAEQEWLTTATWTVAADALSTENLTDHLADMEVVEDVDIERDTAHGRTFYSVTVTTAYPERRGYMAGLMASSHVAGKIDEYPAVAHKELEGWDWSEQRDRTLPLMKVDFGNGHITEEVEPGVKEEYETDEADT